MNEDGPPSCEIVFFCRARSDPGWALCKDWLWGEFKEGCAKAEHLTGAQILSKGWALVISYR